MKSSGLRMTLPERPISCSPWSATGPLPGKGSESGAISMRLSSEAFPAWYSHARQRIAEAIGETGGWGLRNQRVTAEGYIADRRWDAREPRVWADNAMLPETRRQGLTPVEPCDRPSPMHFEMAYQARVASDRIRFAIKHLEQSARDSEPPRWTPKTGQ
jgi:hypothetical protein